jgi:hypothetical protein
MVLFKSSILEGWKNYAEKEKVAKWRNCQILVRDFTISPNRHFYKTPYSKHSKGSSSATNATSDNPLA